MTPKLLYLEIIFWPFLVISSHLKWAKYGKKIKEYRTYIFWSRNWHDDCQPINFMHKNNNFAIFGHFWSFRSFLAIQNWPIMQNLNSETCFGQYQLIIVKKFHLCSFFQHIRLLDTLLVIKVCYVHCVNRKMRSLPMVPTLMPTCHDWVSSHLDIEFHLRR